MSILPEERLGLELPLLQAVNKAATLLLTETNEITGISEGLKIIGEATGVDRVYIFQQYYHQETVFISQRFEWVKQDISIQLDNPDLQDIPMIEAGFGRWLALFAERKPVKGLVKAFPESEQEILQAQDILSLLCLPIYIKEELWGFVGFDDCTRGREWTDREIEVLSNLANTLGGAFMRKRYENSILRIQYDLEAAQRIAHVGNWEIDLSSPTHEVTASEELLRILDMPAHRSEIPLAQLTPELPLAVRKKLLAMYRILRNGGSQYDQVVYFPDVQGKQKWCRLLAEPVLAAGTIIAIRGVLLDVTAYETTNQRLLALTEELQQASQAKTEFLSVMSHEIRTPLNAVIGYTHLLMSEQPRPDQLEYLETLHYSSEHLLALINDILDYSKIEAGKITLERSHIHLSSLLQGIIQTQLPKAEEKAIDLRMELDPALPKQISSDSVRLSQILNNLVSNAVKFTHEGEVVLRAVRLDSHKSRAKLRFEVEDSGIGIEPTMQEKIFESFTQANASTTREFGGTGLGLTITRRLIELFGGEIRLRSEPEVGSVFSFDLEMTIPPEVKAQPVVRHKASDDQMDLEGMRILLVEDNLVNVKVVKKFLTKWNAGAITVARNGQEALEKFDQVAFDLVLMDLQMPVMNGYNATRELRARGCVLPILALTANAEGEILAAVREAGMDDLVTKPFNPRTLYRKLRAFHGVADR